MLWRMIRVFCALALTTTLFAVGYPPDFPEALQRAQWPAAWITAPGAPERDASVLHFRRVIELSAKPDAFIVYVSADNRFLLHVNGRRVGVGPARGDVNHWRFERFDLAPYLKEGRNIIAATVWNFGLEGPYAQMSQRTGFLLQGHDVTSSAADTGPRWEARIETGHGINIEGLAEIRRRRFFYAAGPAERRDGRLFDWGWDQLPEALPKTQPVDAAVGGAHPAGRHWTRAVLISHANPRTIRVGAPYALSPTAWLMVPNELPSMDGEKVSVGSVVREEGARPGPGTAGEGSFFVPARSNVKILLDRRSIVNAYPSITYCGGRDAVIRLGYAESLFDRQGRKGNRNEIEGKQFVGFYDEVVADGQRRTFGPLWWRSFRYLQVEVITREEPLKVEGLQATATGFPLELRASLASDDSQLGELWEMAFRTLRISAHETYMDSPYWEQLQYIGDTRITALLSYLMSNDDRLARQAIAAFDQSRTFEGLTYSRYPSRERQYIPPYSLFWIGMVHDFWMYRDDPAFVRECLPGTRTVIDWFLRRQRSDGLAGFTEYWAHVDPAAGNARQLDDGGSAAVTVQLIAALREAAELEEVHGDAARARLYRDRAAAAVAGLAPLWNAERGLFADNPSLNEFSHDVNILALLLDVAPPQNRQKLAESVLEIGLRAPTAHGEKRSDAGRNTDVMPASIYFRFYLHRALAHAGRGDTFLRLIQPWREMLGLGLSTFPEFSDPTRSDSHAWTAHPALDFLSIVAGVKPGAPGFASVRIEPHPGALKALNARVPHPRGAIDVQYRAVGDGVEARIELPAGLPGAFVWEGREHPLPAGRATTLTLPNPSETARSP